MASCAVFESCIFLDRLRLPALIGMFDKLACPRSVRKRCSVHDIPFVLTIFLHVHTHTHNTFSLSLSFKHTNTNTNTLSVHLAVCLSHSHTNFLSRALLLPLFSHSSMESHVLRAACSVKLRSHAQQPDPQQQVKTVNRLRHAGFGGHA
jgi:hypothetical protein